MSGLCGLCETESTHPGLDHTDGRATPTFILEGLCVAAQMDPQTFLEQLECTADDLGVEETDRSYRESFTENYKPFFPRVGSRYRAELLHACMRQEAQRMVNDQLYKFSPATLTKSLLLKCSLHQLLDILCSWSTTKQCESHTVPDVRPMLRIFDEAWTEFEKHYISDLIDMEAKARSPIVRAVALERELQALERRCEILTTEAAAKQCVHRGIRHIAASIAQENTERHKTSSDSNAVSLQHCISGSQTLLAAATLPSFESSASHIRRLAETASRRWADTPMRDVLQKLVEQIASLNVRNNIQGRGRGDLDLTVLEKAAEVFLISEPTAWSLKECDDVVAASMAARRFLASQVLFSFLEMRNYFTDVADRILFVDPQLSNNKALVARLTKWEESWEIGERFLLRPALLESFCGLAGQIGRAQRIVPDLTTLLENRDAEFFLILPRLVLIFGFLDSFLMPLSASLLPHHFFFGTEELQLSSVMATMFKQFAQVCMELSEAEHSDTWWQALVRGAMAGPGQTHGGAGASEQHEATLEGFLRNLEIFSMELQRHIPEDWNRCCSILTCCVDAARHASATQRATSISTI
eukprot:TRINITY_DN21167_c0_g1_i1.p1 TRINITY_DN21167_c0_g1~~TRINITY_DN21167_c0_g1_i1.p1  ORF type:complete len:612 (+),score=84.64 TRINITY_DN21167_c0_g1_i1:82-1836(+)